MIEFETEVTDIIQRTHNVKSFRFKIEQDVDFKAGQFFLIAIKINGQDKTKHFSFSNAPTEKGFLEFTKKITESEFSRTLDTLKPGDWARIKMAYGNFVLASEDKKIAFLSGGIGITPIRSMCKDIIDKKLDKDISLLYANRSSKDIAFLEDFDLMQKEYPKLKVVHILSKAEEDWSGRRGYINSQVIKEEVSDYNNRKFYICGPPNMVDAMCKILRNEMSIPQKNIVTENFSGY